MDDAPDGPMESFDPLPMDEVCPECGGELVVHSFDGTPSEVFCQGCGWTVSWPEYAGMVPRVDLRRFVMDGMSDMVDRTFEAVTLLLKNSAEVQIGPAGRRMRDESPENYAVEFCSVFVRGPRQSGHTSVARRLVGMFGGEAVVVTARQAGCDVFKGESDNVATVSFMEHLRGVEPLRAVVVDMAQLLSPFEVKKVHLAFLDACVKLSLIPI